MVDGRDPENVGRVPVPPPPDRCGPNPDKSSWRQEARNDPRWAATPKIIEIVSQSFDPLRTGVGSSPYTGDMGNVGVVVPITPSAALTTPGTRYLIRLGGLQIPSGSGIVLRSLRQMITLIATAVVSPAGEEDAALLMPLTFTQTTPSWSFVDGNVSWHLRWQTGDMVPYQTRSTLDAAVPQAGESATLLGYDAALIYQGFSGPGYVAPNGGIPPGAPLEHLGVMYDLRYGWYNTGSEINVPIIGPGQLLFFASVLQTDAANRTALPACNPTSLTPEDSFILAHPNAIYGRVAGAMTVEMFPCSGKKT